MAGHAIQDRTNRSGPINELGKCVGYAVGEFSYRTRYIPCGSADLFEQFAHEAFVNRLEKDVCVGCSTYCLHLGCSFDNERPSGTRVDYWYGERTLGRSNAE